MIGDDIDAVACLRDTDIDRGASGEVLQFMKPEDLAGHFFGGTDTAERVVAGMSGLSLDLHMKMTGSLAGNLEVSSPLL